MVNPLPLLVAIAVVAIGAVIVCVSFAMPPRKRVLFPYLGAGVIVVGVCTGAYFAFVERAREYLHTEFYADTGFVVDADAKNFWHYGQKDGLVTFVLSRGKPHSTVSTAHGWWETLSIEFPSMPRDGKVDLETANVTIGFTSYRLRTSWTIAKQGVHGYLHIISVSEDSVEIEYRIVVNAYNWEKKFLPEYQNEERIFEGTSTFALKDRPEANTTAAEGLLWKAKDDCQHRTAARFGIHAESPRAWVNPSPLIHVGQS